MLRPRVSLCRQSASRSLRTDAHPPRRTKFSKPPPPSPLAERSQASASSSRLRWSKDPAGTPHTSSSSSRLRWSKDPAGTPHTYSSRLRWSKDPAGTPHNAPPSLPRYIRRANSNSVSNAELPSKASNPTFRSRHYDPSREKSPTMRLLEPHVLSSRLKQLADKNQLDFAVSMLKNAPLAAQNTPVWNTLIWECMKARRFKLAYQLFIDMRRRGFSPTTRTFQTMFTGLSRIDTWSGYQQQLSNARSLYDAYQRHIEEIKKHDPDSPELSIDPLPAYITILGNAGQFEEILVLYHSLAKEGPLAANKFLFTAMFRALSVTTTGLTSAHYAKNAADARVLWREVLEAAERPGMEIDSFLVTAVVIALSKGRAPEHELAFQLVREYFGLTMSGEPPAYGTTPLTPQSLAAALSLCNSSQNFNECIHFFQQVLKRPEASGGANIIDRAHGEEVVRAHLSSMATGSARLSLETLEWMLRQESQGPSSAKIRPAVSTYNVVLLACWRGVDWNSATRAFNLMTGYNCHDFMDGAVAASPRVSQRSKGRNLLPTAETMSCMLRTALATQNSANMRQCLRIASHFDSIEAGLFAENKQLATGSAKSTKNRTFHVMKLATAVLETVDFVAANSTPKSEEMKQWNKLKQAALQLFAKRPQPDVNLVPEARSERSQPLTKYEMSFKS